MPATTGPLPKSDHPINVLIIGFHDPIQGDMTLFGIKGLTSMPKASDTLTITNHRKRSITITGEQFAKAQRVHYITKQQHHEQEW